MFRFATSGSFTSNFAGENAGLIARALSSFKGRIKEHLLVVVNTENMKSLSALDHRRMEKFLYLVRPPMRVHQLISRSDIGHKKYYLNLSCHQPHLAFLVSQLIPHQMLSQSHSRCALIDYSERLFRRISASACLWKLSFDILMHSFWSFQYLVLKKHPHPRHLAVGRESLTE